MMKHGELLAVGPTDEVMTAELLTHTDDHPVEVIDHGGRRVILPERSTR